MISYDISNNKLRAKFNRYIRKYGYMKQYSVYEIMNSEGMLEKIMWEIEHKWEHLFEECDSVIVIKTSKNCKITTFGYAKHDEDDILIV